MILFTLLMVVLVVLAAIVVLVLGVGGIAFLLVFGDAIICIWLIVVIIKHIFKKK